MTWNIVTASIRGRSHRQAALPCQDHGAFVRLPGGVVAGAISDGAGSAPHAEIAAQLTTKLALQYLSHWKDSSFTVESREFSRNLLQHLRLALYGVAGIRHSQPRDWACTLIAYLSTPRFLVAMQLGDGFIVVRRRASTDYELLFNPEHGEYVSQTVFVVEPDSSDLLQTAVLEEPVDFICASTDGLERLAINMKTMQPHSPFFRPLDRFVSSDFDRERAANDVTEFLASPDVESRADDDRTLQLAGWANGREQYR